MLVLLTNGSTSSAQSQPVSVIEARIQPDTQWPVASPVTLTVKFAGSVLLASWQWVGQDGKPPVWNGEVLPQRELRPIQDVWAGMMAVPPAPGVYGVRLTVRTPGSSSVQTINLSVRGTAVAEEKLTRGIAFAQDRNLWLLSMDLHRARALTYFGATSSASMPAWSPDGRSIAFILDPGGVGDGPDLWVINPDGTGARQVSAHPPGRSLAYPSFAPDGTLYVAQSRPLSIGGIELAEAWDLQRVDIATGKRVPVLLGAAMPNLSPNGKSVVYVQQELNSDGGVLLGLAASDLDGANERVLVPPKEGQGVFAPDWSPDGKTIVFAGENIGGSKAIEARSELLPIEERNANYRPSSIVRRPSMHGGTWDLWTVPSDGGTPQMLSFAQEELPYPQWTPDGMNILYFDPNGLFRVPASGGPPELVSGLETTSELSIFAPIPQPAPALPGQARCFAETGRCMHGIFLTYWEEKGGLAQFGFPITPELIEEGRTVQYTQRARFEWHVENKGTQSEVLLGRLGADTADAQSSAGVDPFMRKSKAPEANALYFPETGHNLRPPLRAYWEGRGGLPVFGYPMSEAFNEKSATDGKTYLVQYFERNRLEYHPENKGTPNEMLLGLLGVQEYARRYGK